ncbi:DnaJ-domain-containing protein [Martensiomyces pterosporus]|nr:DnaJ-domain-containing protein [Martensiomyces pterosporus]
MEVNRDEAERALEIAQRKWQSGDKAAALKLARKSNSLYPTASASELIKKFESSSAEPSNTPPPTTPSADSGLRNRSTKTNEQASSDKEEGRAYTQDQVQAVKKVMSVRNDYYRILGVEKTASAAEIKKAYRKSALAFHPDKNTAPGADEAFKLVAHAFTVLSDEDKRAHYDRFGTDDNRRSAPQSAGGASMFNAHRGRRFDDEVSPEDLFNMFFGGEFGQFGVQFGPNVRFAQYNQQQRGNHAQYRRRAHQRAEEGDAGVWGSCMQLLPLLLLVFSYFASSLVGLLFGGESPPTYAFSPTSQYSHQRATQNRNVQYWVNSNEFGKSTVAKTPSELWQFEQDVEAQYVAQLQRRCRQEMEYKRNQVFMAKGWFGVGTDKEKVREAENIRLPACEELKRFR